MNEIITWAAQHNTIVIQIIFSIVLLLVLVYVYRLFFVNSPAAAGDSVELNEVNQKLDQLLEQQKNSGIQVIEKIVPQSADSAVAAAADAMAEPPNANELEQAKSENAKLKAQLNELEKKVFELSPIVGADETPKEDVPQVDSAQVAELSKKIEELQSRLSEYDIIADDIAELSQLRAENSELKKKIEGGSGGDTGGSSASSGGESSPAVETSAEVAEVVPEPVASAPAVSAEAAAVMAEAQAEVAAAPEPASAVDGGIPGFDAATSALLESLVAETDAVAQAAEEQPVEAQPKITMDQNIPDAEKNLINEFEKSIQKGS